MRVYLAGPINGRTDDEAHGWRSEAKAMLQNLEWGWLDPMSRDYRGREAENVASIVEGDKNDIDTCDAVIAYCDITSVGTSMEILYAFERTIPVVVVVQPGRPVSPWLAYHAASVVPTVGQAVTATHAVLRKPVDRTHP